MVWGVWVAMVAYVALFVSFGLDGVPRWVQFVAMILTAFGLVYATIQESKNDERLEALEKKLGDKHEAKQDDRLC